MRRLSGVARALGLRRRKTIDPAFTVDKESLRQWLPEAPVIVEAGAHVGVDTAELAACWPKGTVYAFEPVPAIYEQLEARVRRKSNVHLERRALGDRTTERQMWISGGGSDGSSSLLAPKEHLVQHPTVTFEETVTVQVVSLEDWAAERGVERVDFLWLDMQGHEFAMLQTAERILETTSVIVMEVAFKELYEGAPLWGEVRPWLETRGFRVEAELTPWEDGGNAILVRNG